MTTLNGIDLDKVSNIEDNKNANILPLPFPTKDSDETETFDMLGVTRLITVTGEFLTDPITKKESIEALASGQQTSSVAFVSAETQTGTKQVKVASISTNWEVPAFKCRYTIRLIEGN